MNTTRVTVLSMFDDNVWDYRTEYSVAARSISGRRITFAEVWQRNPAMCVVLKNYLWKRLNGGCGMKAIGWRTASNLTYMFTIIAEYAEKRGFNRWSDITRVAWREIYAASPMTRTEWQAFYELERFAEAKIAGGPIGNPLLGIPRRNHIAVKQSELIPAAVMEQLVSECLRFEPLVPVLRQMYADMRGNKVKKWDGSVAGIHTVDDLHHRITDTQYAGMILLLAATGVRISELLSLPRNGLRCNQKTGEWYIRGTVYKFHKQGNPASWVCGDLGRRAFHMIDFGFGDFICSTRKKNLPSASDVGVRMKQWMRERKIMDGEQIAQIHPHQFRRTFAVNMMAHTGFNLMLLKEHFKHKSIKMTDYYVGCGQELYDAIAPHHMPMGEFEHYLRQFGEQNDEMHTQTKRIL